MNHSQTFRDRTEPHGRARRSWEDNMKMVIREVGWRRHGLDRSRARECGNEPSGSIKCGEFLRS